jgi:hypothetical protein
MFSARRLSVVNRARVAYKALFFLTLSHKRQSLVIITIVECDPESHRYWPRGIYRPRLLRLQYHAL